MIPITDPVRFPKEGNEYYPLPPNYPDLNPEDQKLARLNAVHLQETPEDIMTAWAAFKSFYLLQPDSDWYKRYKESPIGHYEMLYDMGKWSTNVWGAPRSFAKSTVVKEAAMLFLLTRRRMDVTTCMATIKKYRKAVDSIKWQFENNPYILNDFGKLKPKRGSAPWGSDILRLPNGSTLEGISVNGRIRGDRPDLLLIDDAEYDDEEEIEQVHLIDDFERLLFKILIPMLDDGTGLFMIGTMISRRSYIYRLARGEDPRFLHFNRRVLAIEDEDGKSVWEQKWDKQKREDLKAMLGEEHYRSEYMNDPGSTSEQILKIDDHLNTYRIHGDTHKGPDPLISSDVLEYAYHSTEVSSVKLLTKKEEFGPWASRLYRILCVDYCKKPSPTSDFACAMVMGFDQYDTLWVLDVYLDKVRGDKFTRKIFELGAKWKVKIIGLESEATQVEMAEKTTALLGRMAEANARDWVPRCKMIKYAKESSRRSAPSQISKPERIAALEWRFPQGMIRLPAHRMNEMGVKQLFHQIEYFTMDLSRLRHDDAVDTLAMHQYVVRGRGRRRAVKRPSEKPIEKILRGERVDPKTGVPHALGIDLNELTPEVLNKVYEQRLRNRPIQKRKGIHVWNQGPVRFFG